MSTDFRYGLLGPIVVGTLSAMCVAEEKPAYVSPTFQDVVKRVEQRDPDSGAILKVKPHPDAPDGARFGLSFQISEVEPGVVIVTLSQPAMTRIVAEEYRLKADDAIRDELGKQKLMEQQKAEKHKAWEHAQRVKIEAVTGGRFHFGTSAEEVRKAMGTPTREEVWQKLGGLTLVYGDTTFTFDGGLTDVTVEGKPTH